MSSRTHKTSTHTNRVEGARGSERGRVSARTHKTSAHAHIVEGEGKRQCARTQNKKVNARKQEKTKQESKGGRKESSKNK